MKLSRPKLTYANVIATLALFLALGGGAYAATQLPRNSVGPNQLKFGAVTPAKLSSASKATMTGARGPDGSQGPKGEKGERGERGERGQIGPEGPFPVALPAGKTIVGVYNLGDTAPASTPKTLVTGDFSYLYRVPGQTVIYVNAGATNPSCTGSFSNPTAPAGFTCIYAQNEINVTNEHGVDASSEAGVKLYAFSAAAGQFQITGSWAATGI